MFKIKLLGIVLVIGLVSVGLVLSQVANAGEYVADANTLALMHFNEGSNVGLPFTYGWPTIAESSGNNNIAIVIGNPWTTGRYGAGIGGAYYDTVWPFLHNNVMLGQGPNASNILDAFTVEFWMKGQASDWGDIMYAGYEAYIYVDANGNIFTVFWASPTGLGVLTGQNFHKSQTAVLDNKWHHVAITYNGITSNMYVDGVLDLTYTWTVSPGKSRADQYWTSVAVKVHNPGPFAGTIDELRISNVARTAQEIAYGADALAPVAVASVTSPAIEATGVLTNVSAYLNCAGSNDPDGGNVTCEWNPVNLPVGTTTVTLTVTDNEGDTAPATVNVTVVDTTPPTITAGLVPVGGSQSEYEVVATATDLVDPNPTVIVTLGVAVEDGQRVNLPPGEGRGHFLIKGATEGVLTVVATDNSGKSSVVDVPITR